MLPAWGVEMNFLSGKSVAIAFLPFGSFTTWISAALKSFIE